MLNMLSRQKTIIVKIEFWRYETRMNTPWNLCQNNSSTFNWLAWILEKIEISINVLRFEKYHVRNSFNFDIFQFVKKMFELYGDKNFKNGKSICELELQNKFARKLSDLKMFKTSIYIWFAKNSFFQLNYKFWKYLLICTCFDA